MPHKQSHDPVYPDLRLLDHHAEECAHAIQTFLYAPENRKLCKVFRAALNGRTYGVRMEVITDHHKRLSLAAEQARADFRNSQGSDEDIALGERADQHDEALFKANIIKADLYVEIAQTVLGKALTRSFVPASHRVTLLSRAFAAEGAGTFTTLFKPPQSAHNAPSQQFGRR